VLADDLGIRNDFAVVADTVEDFWRMLWEHNSTIVVMLTKLQEMGREKCYQYWPDTRSARYQYFVVDPHAEYVMPEYTLREFKVTDARVSKSSFVSALLNSCQEWCRNWPTATIWGWV